MYNSKQNEEKIKTVLTQAQQNILVDIEDAKRIFDVIIYLDPLSRNVLNDVITMETDPKHIDITDIVVDFNTNKVGYRRLINNLENLPEKYAGVIPQFNHIYEVLQADIDNANTALIASGYESRFDRLYSNPEHAESMMNGYSQEETAS